jgi:hypothetical protein
VIPANEETKSKLNIKGNLLQALGSTMSLPELLNSENRTIDDLLNIYGSLLQAIGNSLQAIGEKIELRNGNGQTINFVGSWIQAIGAVIQALVQSKNYDQNQIKLVSNRNS